MIDPWAALPSFSSLASSSPPEPEPEPIDPWSSLPSFTDLSAILEQRRQRLAELEAAQNQPEPGFLDNAGAVLRSVGRAGQEQIANFGRGVEDLASWAEERSAETPWGGMGAAVGDIGRDIGRSIAAPAERQLEPPTDPRLIAQEQRAEEIRAAGGAGGFGLTVAEQVPQLATTFTAGGLAGTTGALGTMGVQTFGAAMDKFRAMGLSEEQARIPAAREAAIETITETIGDVPLVRALGAAAPAVGSRVYQLIQNIANNAGQEYVADALSQVNEGYTQRVAAGQDPGTAVTEALASIDPSQSLQAAAVGAVIPAATLGPTMAAEAIGERRQPPPAPEVDPAALELRDRSLGIAEQARQQLVQRADPWANLPSFDQLTATPEEASLATSEPPNVVAPEPTELPTGGGVGRGPAGVLAVPVAGEPGVLPVDGAGVPQGDPASGRPAGEPGIVRTGFGDTVPLPVDDTAWRGEGDAADAPWVGDERGPSHIAGQHFATDPLVAAHWARGYGERGVLRTARLNIKNPFSVASRYTYEEARSISPSIAQRAARIAGVTDPSQPIDGMSIHMAAADEYLEQNQLDPRDSNAMGDSKRHAYATIVAAGYDSIHHKVRDPGRPGVEVDSYAIQPGTEKTLRKQRITEMPIGVGGLPSNFGRKTIEYASPEERAAAMGAIGPAPIRTPVQVAPAPPPTAEEIAAREAKQKRSESAKAGAETRSWNKEMLARFGSEEAFREWEREQEEAERQTVEGAWDRTIDALLEREDDLGAEEIERRYTALLAQQQASGLDKDEFAASLGPQGQPVATPSPGEAPEAEAAAVHRQSWQRFAEEALGPAPETKDGRRKYVGRILGMPEFQVERSEDGVAYASWVGDPTSPDDAQFIDDIEVPYKPGDTVQAIKVRMAQQMMKMLAGEAVPAGRAAAGRFRPTFGRSSVRGKPIEPTTGEATGEPGPSGRLRLAMPELVELGEALMQGKLPEIHKNLGKARGRMIPGPGGTARIQLKADLFKTPDQAAATLAHEIGHVVDYLPEGTFARGNVLGRIASLKRYLQSTLWSLDLKTVRNELLEVSDAWRPGLKEATGAYKAYRRKGEELYADAFSMLLNDPDRLARMAPTFFNGVMERLDRKPEFRKSYDELTDRGMAGEEAIAAAREGRVAEMLEAGAKTQLKNLVQERKALSPREALHQGAKVLVDRNAALYRLRNQARKQGGAADLAGASAVRAIEEMALGNSAAAAYVHDFAKKVLDPLDAAGATLRETGALLFYRRIVGERSELANPLGIGPKEADALLSRLQKKLGNEKFDRVTKALDEWRQTVRQPLLDALAESGALADPLIEKILSNADYARFEVMKYAEDPTKAKAAGLASLRKQIGTLERIGNPLLATVVQDLALQRLVDRTNAAKAVAQFAQQMGVAEKAPKRWTGRSVEPKEPSDPDKGLITYLQGGKVEGWIVPKGLAEMFERSPQQASTVATLWDRVIAAPLRTIFITHNPGFAIWNTQKDLRATIKKTPGYAVGKRVKLFAQATAKLIKPAWRGELLGEEVEMLRERAIYAPGKSVWKANEETSSEEAAFEALVERVGLSDKAHREQVRVPLVRWAMRLGRGIEKSLSLPSEISERASKLAGYEYLKQTQPKMSTAERAELVRNRVGTPNTQRRGAAWGLYNRLFMFSNVAKEGYRQSWEAFREDPVSYTLKATIFDIMPAVVAWAFAQGLLGSDDEKEWWATVPEHDKANYTIIPLGWTADGKAIYSRLPHDYEGQLWRSITWKTLNGKLESEDLVRALIENFPFGPGQLNPALDAASYPILYAAGKNPMDQFRGTSILTDREFEAGGWQAWQKVLQTSWNEVGGSLYRFKSNEPAEVLSELEQITGTPVIGPVLQRGIKVSDAGRAEVGRTLLREEREKKARAGIARDEAIEKALRADREVNAYALRERLRAQGIDVYGREGDFINRVKEFKIRLYGTREERLKSTARSKRERELLESASHSG